MRQFSVGTAVAGPGERAFGHLSVLLEGREALAVPCWVLQGRAKRGRPDADAPVLYVHSTQHGNEISGIEVVRRVAQALDPNELWGTLIAVPVANPLAFQWRRHHYLQGPEEAYQARPELDIDHWWPGVRDGTPVQRLAYALWHGAVRHATHVLDMHTWNRWQAAATTVRGWHEPSLDLARAFGQWVQLRPETPADDAGEFGSIAAVSVRHGIAACAPNFTGQWDIYEVQVRRGVAALRNVLRHLGMIAGRPWPMEASRAAAPAGRRGPPIFRPTDLVDVVTPHAGIFLPRVQPEESVQRGQPLGLLVRQEDYAPIEVAAPQDALVYLAGAITPGSDVALPSMMPLAAAGGRVARLLPV